MRSELVGTGLVIEFQVDTLAGEPQSDRRQRLDQTLSSLRLQTRHAIGGLFTSSLAVGTFGCEQN